MYFAGRYPSFCHCLRSFGELGNVNSAETDVGPSTATSRSALDFAYRSLNDLTNASHRLRYVSSHGIGSVSTVPLPGPYWMVNWSVCTLFSAHAGEKNPGKMSKCTHFFDASAEANTSSNFDQSGFPST